MQNSVLKVKELTRRYRSGNGELTVLDRVSFVVGQGASCAIVGPSGSGKTTLIGLCAGLDRPSSGAVVLDGMELNSLTEDEVTRLRNQRVGFVFQTFQLIPTLTALENVLVPVELRGEKGARSLAVDLLNQVGLGERLGHYPAQLSGGEQQRISLARAFINRPKILFADEPTGNLDAENSDRVAELLFGLNRAHGTTLVLVTHNLELARQTRSIIHLKGGRIEFQEEAGESRESRDT